jgi:hypothetical protein
LRLLTAAGACLFTCTLLRAQVNVTTYHNDVARTGQNTQETILTPANVNATQFGKLFSVAVDGVVYAQPLYLSAVAIAGGMHNVLYVATEHDSVFAIDADSGTVYAQASLIPAGGSTVNSDSDLHCGDLVPEVGITGTPVIDPATGTLYVVAKSKVNGLFHQYLHALDTGTLAEKFNGPVAIQATVAGSGYDASGGVVTFNALQENQRTALLLEGGHVIMGWSSHCDNDPWHGWVMSYSASTLAQEAAFNTSPNGSRNGVWMSGAGAAADASGNVYFATGNGTWNGTTDYGDSIVKLGAPAAGSFPVVDYFTPYNQGKLAADDTDLAAGGLVLLPTLPSGQQLLAQQGKQGTIYLLNTAELGHYCPNLTPACSGRDTNVVQEIFGASPGIWGSPAYWNGNLYWTGANDSIKAYSFNANGSGLISTSPTSASAQIFAFSAPTPAISSNGNANGILWALDGSADDSTCDGGGSNCLGLYAYDATNLANLLYTSSQAPGNRDSPGVAVKFEKPIVANGKVYVGTQSSVTVYGLLVNALPPAAPPTLNPTPGAYLTPQTITLSDATPGASIYYTTNGTPPTASSTPYRGPFQASSTQIIEAIAIAAGYSQSATTQGIYDFSEAPPNVNLSAVANIDAIGVAGDVAAQGGIDQSGDAYVASLLGSSITWNGSTFTLGAVNSQDAVANAVIPLTPGNYSALNLLGTGVNGNQPNQTFVVTYSDGSTTSIIQSMSGWNTPQKYSGEYRVLDMPDRLGPAGKLQKGSYFLYGYSLALDSSKTAVSLTLPNNRNVVILAVDVSNTAVNDPAGFSTSNGLNFVQGAVRVQQTLELTEKSKNLARAVWTASPVNVQNFTTDFTFQISPASANTGDGMTFTLQNAGPTVCGAADAGQGYAGITPSVAVKFDLYNDAGEGPDSTGFYVNGASPTVPALDLRPSGVNLHSGDVMHAHLTYDGATLTLVLTDTVSGASFTAAQAINIPATLGANRAYAGFTASTGSTGAQVSVQQVLSWTYTSGQTPVINYPTGFAGAALTLSGVTLSGGALELTAGGPNEAGSAWTPTRVNVQKFTTDFDILESEASADGLTFTVQNAGPSALGAKGGGLGYAGIGSSVAVKFDLYNNAGEGIDSTGFYLDGASPTVPALDMTASGVNLHGADPLHAHINYDGVTLALTLTDIVTGATFSAAQAIDIPATVGGNTAYVGFTGGTGGLTAVQQILSWTYVVN